MRRSAYGGGISMLLAVDRALVLHGGFPTKGWLHVNASLIPISSVGLFPGPRWC